MLTPPTCSEPRSLVGEEGDVERAQPVRVSLRHGPNSPAEASPSPSPSSPPSPRQCGGERSEPDPGRFDSSARSPTSRPKVELGPRPMRARRPTARTSRPDRGAPAAAGVEDVVVQRPWRNVVGTIPGSGRRDPAHRPPRHQGRFRHARRQRWRLGVAVVLEIRAHCRTGSTGHLCTGRALRRRGGPRGSRDFERDGQRGSRRYVRYAREAKRRGGAVQGTPPLREIDSMILLDLVGDCDLQVPRGNSDPDL